MAPIKISLTVYSCLGVNKLKTDTQRATEKP